MAVECMRASELRELCSRFPLTPIEDDDSYRAALEILDRLFDRDDRQSRAESLYFSILAEIVFEYESKQNIMISLV
jgi:antitoxin component HigA of HigAB toxin-antitoxin module